MGLGPAVAVEWRSALPRILAPLASSPRTALLALLRLTRYLAPLVPAARTALFALLSAARARIRTLSRALLAVAPWAGPRPAASSSETPRARSSPGLLHLPRFSLGKAGGQGSPAPAPAPRASPCLRLGSDLSLSMPDGRLLLQLGWSFQAGGAVTVPAPAPGPANPPLSVGRESLVAAGEGMEVGVAALQSMA